MCKYFNPYRKNTRPAVIVTVVVIVVIVERVTHDHENRSIYRTIAWFISNMMYEMIKGFSFLS